MAWGDVTGPATTWNPIGSVVTDNAGNTVTDSTGDTVFSLGLYDQWTDIASP